VVTQQEHVYVDDDGKVRLNRELEMASLPDPLTTVKVYPLQRTLLQQAASVQSKVQACPPDNDGQPRERSEAPQAFENEAQEFAAMHQLEERFLVAWAEDNADGVNAISAKARSCIDAAVARMRAEAPDVPPPGLRKWPEEAESFLWSPKIWEKVCKAAAGWAEPGPGVTETEAARGLLWLEASMLNDIIMSVDALCLSGRIVLGGAKRHKKSPPQVLFLRRDLQEQGMAERAYFQSMLISDCTAAFFEIEVHNLPTECDRDIGGLHALVQSTNAELNVTWKAEARRTREGPSTRPLEEQLLRIVRLRELALYALVLLVKQAQSLKLFDTSTLAWLHEVQQGCQMILHKSQLLCEAVSMQTVDASSEDVIRERLELDVKNVEDHLVQLEKVALQVQTKATRQDAAAFLTQCDTDLLRGHLLLHSLEQRLEASGACAAKTTIDLAVKFRLVLHQLMLRTVVVRGQLDLPCMDAADTALSRESVRPGRDIGVHFKRRAQVVEDASSELADPKVADKNAEELLRTETFRRKSTKTRQATQKRAKGKAPVAESRVTEKLTTECEVLLHTESVSPAAAPLPCGQSQPLAEQEPAQAEQLVQVSEACSAFLREGRRAYLHSVQRATGATCALDCNRREVVIRGATGAVAAAVAKIEELRAEWMELDASLWVVTRATRSSPEGHISLLVHEAGCHVQVDRENPRVRLAGTETQVQQAQLLLARMLEDCGEQCINTHLDCSKLQAIVGDCIGDSTAVQAQVRPFVKNGVASMVQLLGDARQVAAVAERLQQSLQQMSPVMTSDSKSTCTEAPGKLRSTSSSPSVSGVGEHISGSGMIRTPSTWSLASDAPPFEEELDTFAPPFHQSGQDTEMNAAGDRRSASDRVVGHATAMQLMQANPGARILIGPPDSQGSVAVQPSSAEVHSSLPAQLQAHAEPSSQDPYWLPAADDPNRIESMMKRLQALLYA